MRLINIKYGSQELEDYLKSLPNYYPLICPSLRILPEDLRIITGNEKSCFYERNYPVCDLLRNDIDIFCRFNKQTILLDSMHNLILECRNHRIIKLNCQGLKFEKKF